MKIFAAAVVLSLVAYVPAIWVAQPVYEDAETIDPALSGPALRLGSRALTNLTLAVAPAPRAARAVSLGLHLVVVALVIVLMRQVSGTWSPLAAALLVLHPMATETVMYLSGRGELVTAIGVLLACLGAAGRWWTPVPALLVVCGALVAVGGKQAGAVVFLLVPFVIWCRREDGPRWPYSRIPAVVCALAIVAGIDAYGGLHALVNADGQEGYTSALAVRWDEWAQAQSGAVAYWLGALVNPWLLTPDADIDALAMWVRVSGTLVIVGSLGAAVVWRVYGLGIFAAALLLRLVIQTPGSYLNAHQFYLPWIGLAIGASEVRASWRMVRV